MRTPITIMSILVCVAMTLGSAVGEHLEKRAQHDRFSFGEAEPITFAAQ
jgi:hypothetical protein